MAKMVKGDVTKMIVIAGAIWMLAPTQATAQIITRCGSSSGYVFFFPNTLAEPADTGWQQDSVSSGEILLIYNDDEPDIIHSDRGELPGASVKDNGAVVMEVQGADPGFRSILVIYGGGTVEHFLFGLDADGFGTAAWGTLRGRIVPKNSLMTATCKAP